MDKEQLKIRKATEKDYKAVNSLYYETYNLYYRNIPESYKETPKKILARGTFLNMIEDENARVLVAESDNQVVGTLYATIEKEEDDAVTHGYHRISIDEVSVCPDYRSKGIGSLLMKEIENWARENKICDLTTLVYAFNEKAINFYENNGYAPYSVKLNKKI